MALFTFSDPTVQSTLSKAILLQADVSKNLPADQGLLTQYNLIGLPAILFIGPDQVERNSYRVVGYMQPEDFIVILRKILPKPLS
jgi:thioredoxin:protein disulfide reductase